jgi:hypothetical protein
VTRLVERNERKSATRRGRGRRGGVRVVGPTQDIAESYVPMNITVSYAGQDGTPKPFLMIISWIKVGKDWKVASEIILPVPPATAAKGKAAPDAYCPPRPRRLLLWDSTFPMGQSSSEIALFFGASGVRRRADRLLGRSRSAPKGSALE